MNRSSWQFFTLGGVAGALAGTALTASLFLVGPLSGPEDLEPGGLKIYSGADPSGQRQQLIDMWNDLQPDNPAELVELQEIADDQYATMTEGAGDADIFNLDVTWTARFAAPVTGQPLIRPIDESRLGRPADESFMEKPLRTCWHKGQLWALPFNTDAGLLYYRTDLNLGVEAEPPFDWPKLISATEKALATPGSKFEAGYVGQLDLYEGLTVNFLEVVWAIGADIAIGTDGRVEIDIAKWNEAVRLISPAREGQPGIVLPESAEFEEGPSRRAFQEGRVPFMRNWPVAHRALSTGEATGAQTPPAGKRISFDLANLPGPSVLGGQNLAISANTKKPRAAQELIEFLTGEGSQRRLFNDGGFAATQESIYEDEEIKQKYHYLPTLRNAIAGARFRPESPNYVAFSQELGQHVRAVLLGRAASLPEDLADQLTEALQGR